MADTTMRLERSVDGDILFSGAFSGNDFVRLELDHFDRALLDDCGAQGRTAADWLLALEMLFRRMAEQRLCGTRCGTDAEKPKEKPLKSTA